MTFTVKSVTVNGKVCVLKHSDNPAQAAEGRSYYLVIDGKTHYPKKVENVADEKSARDWANRLLKSLQVL